MASARAMPTRWRWPPESWCGIAARRAAAAARRGAAAPAPARLGAARSATMPWTRERLGDDLAHRHARVERAVGVLEDHLHPAAHRAQLGVVERRRGPAPRRGPGRWSAARAAGCSGRWWSCRSRTRRRGPSVSPRRIVEADAVDRLDDAGPAAEQAAADREVLDQVLTSRATRGRRRLRRSRPRSRASVRGARLPAAHAAWPVAPDRIERRRLDAQRSTR